MKFGTEGVGEAEDGWMAGVCHGVSWEREHPNPWEVEGSGVGHASQRRQRRDGDNGSRRFRGAKEMRFPMCSVFPKADCRGDALI